MLNDYRIKHCNCVENVLGNIILNEYDDEGLLFIDSWKFNYDPKERYLRDMFSVYSSDFSDLYLTSEKYYGISIEKIIDSTNISMDKIKQIFDENKYVALQIKSCVCPWLSFLHEIHGDHMILVMEYNDGGAFCSDNSEKRFFLSYDFLLQNVKGFVIFSHNIRVHDKNILKKKIKNDISNIAKSDLEKKIKSFAKEFDKKELVDEEISMCELITAPLVKRISLVGFSRVNYTKAIRYVYEDEAVMEELNELFELFNINARNWQLINKFLTKYDNSKDCSYLSLIRDTLYGIAESEHGLAMKLNSTLNY